MPRVTHVKKAQQRYETKPVIDPVTGEQKRTPVMVKNYDGQLVQKTTKRGREVFMLVTEPDKTKPKDNLRCDFSGCTKGNEIKPGEAYKHISPKSGPYGGRQLNRHEEHPTWNQWEYSSSMSARLAQIAHNFWEEIDSVASQDDVQSALDSAAEEIKSLAEEKRESASNIEDGFGHPTSASEELEQTADSLDEWADEVSGADIPELPEPEETECEECGGTGEVDSDEVDANEEPIQVDCEQCDGTGQYTPEEPTEDQLDEWRDEVRDALTIVDESPV